MGVHESKNGYVFATWLVDTTHFRQAYGLGALDTAGHVVCFKEYVELQGFKLLFGTRILRIFDSTFVVAGQAYNPDGVLLVVFNDQCDTLFTRIYTTTFGEEVSGMVVQGLRACSDGGYIITNGFSGYEYPHLRRELGVYKLDRNFDLEWSRTFGGVRGQQGVDIVETQSGGFLIFGIDYWDHDPAFAEVRRSLYFIELDAQGELIRERKNGHELRSSWYSVVETPDHEYILCSSQLYWEGFDLIAENGIVRLNKDLDYVWETTAGTLRRTFNVGYRHIVESVERDGVVAAGTAIDVIDGITHYYGVITKVSWEGDSIWSRYYMYNDSVYPTDLNSNYIWRIEPTSDNGYIASGGIFLKSGTPLKDFRQQIWFLKMDAYGCLVPGCHLPTSVETPSSEDILVNSYPSPFADILNVHVRMPEHGGLWSLSVYNVSGNTVYAKQVSINELSFVINTRDWQPGAYIVSVSQGGVQRHVQKVLKVH